MQSRRSVILQLPAAALVVGAAFPALAADKTVTIGINLPLTGADAHDAELIKDGALLALDEKKKVLVLDEFTSALDSQTERALIENLRPYLAGRTVLIIAHRLATIKEVADKIVVIQQGHVAEQGSHSELMDQNGWYAEMARIQAVADSHTAVPRPEGTGRKVAMPSK